MYKKKDDPAAHLLALQAPIVSSIFMFLSRSILRPSIRTMSALVGRSGRQYPRGEVLRRHPTDAEYDIYKTQYVFISVTSYTEMGNVLMSLHPDQKANLSSTNACLSRFSISLNALRRNLQALATFECPPIWMSTTALYSIPGSEILCCPCCKSTRTFPSPQSRRFSGALAKP